MTASSEVLSPAPHPRATTVPIVALDVADAAAALALVDRVGPDATHFKVGLQLFSAVGPEVVKELSGRGYEVFLDLKLHDIPNTVAGAVEAAGDLGVRLLTLHASGGRAMLRAARRAADAGSSDAPLLLGVTLLTSLAAGEVADAWGREAVDAEAEVLRLAAVARDEGLDGVVASVHEAEAIRRDFGPDFLIVTPGIRLDRGAPHDQARVATPARAARAGANYIVVGRAVTTAPDPAAAFARVAEALFAAAEQPGGDI